MVSHSPWHSSERMSSTIDRPGLELQATDLLDLICGVLDDDLQLRTFLLKVRELVASRVGDTLIGHLQALRGIPKKSLEMKEFLLVTLELCVLFLQGLFPAELPFASWTFSWRRRDHLSWSIWRGAVRRSRNITCACISIRFVLRR